MSSRLGMADGRCFTMSSSHNLFNNYIMQQNGIPVVDNYGYRKFLQQQGPDAVFGAMNQVQPFGNNMRGSPLCIECNAPIVKVPSNIY